jgi:hypothetical protein
MEESYTSPTIEYLDIIIYRQVSLLVLCRDSLPYSIVDELPFNSFVLYNRHYTLSVVQCREIPKLHNESRFLITTSSLAFRGCL